MAYLPLPAGSPVSRYCTTAPAPRPAPRGRPPGRGRALPADRGGRRTLQKPADRATAADCGSRSASRSTSWIRSGCSVPDRRPSRKASTRSRAKWPSRSKRLSRTSRKARNAGRKAAAAARVAAATCQADDRPTRVPRTDADGSVERQDQDRHARIGRGSQDDEVDVEQPVAQHRGAEGHGHGRQHKWGDDPNGRRHAPQGDGHGKRRAPVAPQRTHPLELLPDDAVGMPEPHHQRRQRPDGGKAQQRPTEVGELPGQGSQSTAKRLCSPVSAFTAEGLNDQPTT